MTYPWVTMIKFAVLNATYLTTLLVCLFSTFAADALAFSLLGVASVVVQWFHYLEWVDSYFNVVFEQMHVSFEEFLQTGNLAFEFFKLTLDSPNSIWTLQWMLTIPILGVYFYVSQQRQENHTIPAWTFMILGLLGSVGTSFALHVAKEIKSHHLTTSKRVIVPYWIVLIYSWSLYTLASMPTYIASIDQFYSKLYWSVGLMFVPVFVSSIFYFKRGINPKTMFFAMALFTMVINLGQLYDVFNTNNSIGDILDSVWRNLCQKAVWYDLLFLFETVILFVIHELGRFKVSALWALAGVVLGPIVGVPTILAFTLGARELYHYEKIKVE